MRGSGWLRSQFFPQEVARQAIRSHSFPARTSAQGSRDVIVNFYFVMTRPKPGHDRNSSKSVRVVCGVMSIPELNRLFIAIELFRYRINFLFAVHSIFVLLASYHEPKSARQPCDAYE